MRQLHEWANAGATEYRVLLDEVATSKMETNPPTHVVVDFVKQVDGQWKICNRGNVSRASLTPMPIEVDL